MRDEAFTDEYSSRGGGSAASVRWDWQMPVVADERVPPGMGLMGYNKEGKLVVLVNRDTLDCGSYTFQNTPEMAGRTWFCSKACEDANRHIEVRQQPREYEALLEETIAASLPSRASQS